MRDVDFNKKQVAKYLAWTFALAYIIQGIAAHLYHHGSVMTGQLVIAAMMFVPALGVLLSGHGVFIYISGGNTLGDIYLRVARNSALILLVKGQPLPVGTPEESTAYAEFIAAYAVSIDNIVIAV